VAEEVFGQMGRKFRALFDDAKLTEFQETMRDLRPPRICSDKVLPWEEYWGLRVVGQSFVWDSYVFQNCVYDKVPDRTMPSGLDVMAALGSEEAWEREPFDEFDGSFEVNLDSVREDLSLLDEGDWNESLYTAWLHSLQSLQANTTGEGFPPFMRTEAWSAKELNTQMASWTQLTHDTLLYRKQTALFSYGSPHIPLPNITYVEPIPELYSRMNSMVEATIQGLELLSMAPETIVKTLTDFRGHLEVLERVAIQQLTGEQPSDEDMDACRYFYLVTEWQSQQPDRPRERCVHLAQPASILSPGGSGTHTVPSGHHPPRDGSRRLRRTGLRALRVHSTAFRGPPHRRGMGCDARGWDRPGTSTLGQGFHRVITLCTSLQDTVAYQSGRDTRPVPLRQLPYRHRHSPSPRNAASLTGTMPGWRLGLSKQTGRWRELGLGWEGLSFLKGIIENPIGNTFI
jgi:hypothetical protein